MRSSSPFRTPQQTLAQPPTLPLSPSACSSGGYALHHRYRTRLIWAVTKWYGLIRAVVFALAFIAILSSSWMLRIHSTTTSHETEIGKQQFSSNNSRLINVPSAERDETSVQPSEGTRTRSDLSIISPIEARVADKKITKKKKTLILSPNNPLQEASTADSEKAAAGWASFSLQRFVRLRRIDAEDVKKLVAERERMAASKGLRKDQNFLQIILQSSRTGAILHPVGFSTSPKCDEASARVYADMSSNIQRKSNTLLLPTSGVAGCLNTVLNTNGTDFFSFSPDATTAVMAVRDFNAAVYNVTLAARKFKKVGEDGMAVVGGGNPEEDGADTSGGETPKDLRLRAANYGTYLSREVHHGTVTVDKMWARSMESWTVASRETEAGQELQRVYELRGIPHDLQPNGAQMCLGFDGPTMPSAPPAIVKGKGKPVARANRNHSPPFVPPRFLPVEDTPGRRRGRGGASSKVCDTYILWELEEGEAERVKREAASTQLPVALKASISIENEDGQGGTSASPIHFVAALSIRNRAVFNSDKHKYNDKVVFDNWLRLLQKGNLRYPSVLTQLALCLDVAEDLDPILSAAEAYGYTVESGAVAVLRSPSSSERAPPPDSPEGRYPTHRSLREFFATQLKGGNSDKEEGGDQASSKKTKGPLNPVVPLMIISAHCEKHPVYKNQPTYRGAFAFAEYVLRSSQLHIQKLQAAHQQKGKGEDGDDVFHPLAVDTSFVAFANSDIVLDYTDVFRTLGAVVAEMQHGLLGGQSIDAGSSGEDEDTLRDNLSSQKPRPVLVSGRRWNCGTQQIQKAMRKRKPLQSKLNKKGKKRKATDNKEGSEDERPAGEDARPPSLAGSGGTYMDTHYLRTRCSLFGDNAQDYFIVTAGALHWGMPPGLRHEEEYDGAEGALRRAVDNSHRGVSVLVEERVREIVKSTAGGLLGPDNFADSLVPAHEYRRGSRAQRWNSHKHLIPPFVVGGIAFDNWFVSAMMDKRRPDKQRGTREPLAWVIDASSSLYAFHINHDEGRFQSHRAPKSEYNLEIAHYCHGWPEGKVGASPIVSLRLPFDTSSSSTLPSEIALTAAVAARDGDTRRGIVDEPTRVVIHRRSILYCPVGMPAERCALPPPNVERRVLAFDGPFEPRR